MRKIYGDSQKDRVAFSCLDPLFADRRYRKVNPRRDEQTEPETIGIMVESLAALNPGPEIELIAEHLFRVRVLAIEQRK